jgi:hypothetical protein
MIVRSLLAGALVLAASCQTQQLGLPRAEGGWPGGVCDSAEPSLDELRGIYEVSGTDPTYGDYAGQAELRWDAALSRYRLSHLVRFTSAMFEDLHVAQAWEGDLVDATHPFQAEVRLHRARFIRQYDGLTRTPADATPIVLGVTLRCVEGEQLEAVLSAEGLATTTETWTLAAAGGSEPLWQSHRELVPLHEPMPEDTRDTYFDLFETFYLLPEIAPYTERPEFQAAMNYAVYDPTDFAYLREHPDTIRVIQAVIDPISMLEAKLRHRGYAYTLAEKAAQFDPVVPERHINAAGMMSTWQPGPDGTGYHRQSGDSLLWTGMYVASQAMRYRTTGEAVALDNLRRSLDAIFVCHAITMTAGEFCRSLRPHVVDGDPKWIRGTAPYEHLDWLSGGNNDMSNGLAIGMLWGWLTLRSAGGDPTREQRIVAITEDLLDHSSIVNDGRLNELRWTLFHYLITDDWRSLLTYEVMYPALEPVLIDEGTGIAYLKGLALDSSGTHLSMVGLWNLWQIAHELGHEHEGDYRIAMRHALETMGATRLGLFQLVTGTLGDYATPPPERERGLWLLREYPIVKQDLDFDHRVSAEFCMAPWPALPWKNDWTVEDRSRSLAMLPLFERNLDHDYQWKAGPNEYKSNASTVEGAYIDFLVAYWFARYYGVITPEM